MTQQGAAAADLRRKDLANLALASKPVFDKVTSADELTRVAQMQREAFGEDPEAMAALTALENEHRERLQQERHERLQQEQRRQDALDLQLPYVPQHEPQAAQPRGRQRSASLAMPPRLAVAV